MNPEHTKILLVDDEPDILEILKYNLTNEGYEVVTAKDGDEALEKARRGLYFHNSFRSVSPSLVWRTIRLKVFRATSARISAAKR